MREIVTIQLGRSANFICTHFWNAQESYQTFAPDPPSRVDHDIHFRQGLGPDGSDTFLPRTLIYDLKNEFGSLARVNTLENLGNEEDLDAIWNGPLKRVPPDPLHEPSPYAHSLLNGSNAVLPTPLTTRYFADFASTYFHPRSLFSIAPPSNNVDLANVLKRSADGAAVRSYQSPQFTSFQMGTDLFATRNAETDILDEDVRSWIEECDNLQAIEMFASSDDSWSGFASRYVEQLRDELGKTCIWIWGTDGLTNDRQGRKSGARLRERVINTALGLTSFCEQGSMYIPLGMPSSLPLNIDLNPSALWHTSGFLSSAVEGITLPTRLKESSVRVPTIIDWQDMLSGGGRRTIAALDFDPGFDVENLSTQLYDPQTLSADTNEDEGIKELHGWQISLFPTLVSSGSQVRLPSRRKVFTQIESICSASLDSSSLMPHEGKLLSRSGSVFERYLAPIDYPLLPTYPRIYSDLKSAQAIPSRACLTTSSSISSWVRSLQSTVKMRFGSTLAGEEKEALLNSLGDIAETYIEDWESADESEEDD